MATQSLCSSQSLSPSDKTSFLRPVGHSRALGRESKKAKVRNILEDWITYMGKWETSITGLHYWKKMGNLLEDWIEEFDDVD